MSDAIHSPTVAAEYLALEDLTSPESKPVAAPHAQTGSS
jgi:hypothetical protein